ncbi:MAG TPA: LCP family protein [Dongiaceae bacterium]|nr:LCP family protein [Dongiaceae bacterium]
MNNRRQSIDGFVPRRAGSELGEQHTERRNLGAAPARKELRSEMDLENAPIGAPRPGKAIGRSDIDESLRQLEDEPTRKLSRRERKRLKRNSRTPAQKRRRRLVKFLIFVIIIALVVTGGIVAFKAFKATGSILKGNIFDLIQNQPLKEDANGRSNFLILGTSEDDPGHQGGNLTDSMMVLSIDQKNKNAYMFSIPRDLYVNYGMACASGYRGKINVYFSCVNDGTDDASEQDRLTKTQAFVGDIIGMDIQYGVHVNYTVMRDVVNAIGGSITVDIQGDGSTPAGIPAGSIMDSNFDWKCGATYAQRLKNCAPRGHFIDYGPGPQTLDAEHALYLAQARGDAAPTWGLAQSNFDRERNQQKILMAMREKAMSGGTLTNISAVTNLIDALGNNLRTNIQTKEVRTLMDLAQNIKQSDVNTLDLYTDTDAVFTTGPTDAGSAVYPKAGMFDYSDLQAFLAKKLSSNPVTREGANVTVLNGSGVAGAAQTAADKLKSQGFIVDEVGNAPSGTYDTVEVYQLNPKMTATAAALQKLYGVTPKTTKPPVAVTSTTDFVVIIGSQAANASDASSGSGSTSGAGN